MPTPKRTFASLAPLVLAGLLALATLGCTNPPDKGEAISLNGEVRDRPAWVADGRHADYPDSEFFVAFSVEPSEYAPDKRSMIHLLARDMHTHVYAPLASALPENLAAASKSGQWIRPWHIPESKVEYLNWRDSEHAAALVAVRKSDIWAFARDLQDRGTRILGKEAPETPAGLSAVELLASYMQNFADAVDDLSVHVLARGSEAAKQLDAGLVRDAEVFALRTLNLREFFRVTVDGGNRSLELGARLPQPLEMSLLYAGQPAAQVPLRAITGALKADADTVTDVAGRARIRLPQGITYTGEADNLVGFCLAPDLLNAGFRSGLEFQPWRTRLTLPARDNTLVFISVNTRLGDGTASNSVAERLSKMVVAAGMPCTRSTPIPAEVSQDYVLELQGNLVVTPIVSGDGSAPRQVAVDGNLILRHWQSTTPALATVPIKGFGNIVAGDLDRASREAMEDAWRLARSEIVRTMRDVFPPIFRVDALEALKRQEELESLASPK